MERLLVQLDTETLTLRALLSNLIDYAGLYPPAALPLPQVIANYQLYLKSPEAWMLNRLVLPRGHSTTLGNNWRVTLLTDSDSGPQPPQIETLETKTGHRLSLPTYCEVPLEQIQSGFAKIRCTGITSEALADFLFTAAARRLPFKATAGLHHPVRSANMHGFLNVFIAATFAWYGMDRATLRELLDETNPLNFEFTNEALQWRTFRATPIQIEQARRDFAHSFGSCSFEEPVNDLRALRLIS